MKSIFKLLVLSIILLSGIRAKSQVVYVDNLYHCPLQIKVQIHHDCDADESIWFTIPPTVSAFQIADWSIPSHWNAMSTYSSPWDWGPITIYIPDGQKAIVGGTASSAMVCAMAFPTHAYIKSCTPTYVNISWSLFGANNVKLVIAP